MNQHLIQQLFDLICRGEHQTQWERCLDSESQLRFLIDSLSRRFAEEMRESDYQALEKQVQKYENEIRKHIRTEQQIKLYAESLQSKLEEQELTKHDLLSNSKALLNTLKKENLQLQEQLQQLKDENHMLKIKLMEVHENLNGHQSSPTQERYKFTEHPIKSNSKYSTIDSQLPKSRRYSKIVDETKSQQPQEAKTQISQTIDPSILKMINQKKDVMKDRRDSEKVESHRMRQFGPQQARTISQNQKQQAGQPQAQQTSKITTVRQEGAKFELKSQKITDNYKQFLTTYNYLCQKSQSNSRQENRQKKSISEHIEKRKDIVSQQISRLEYQDRRINTNHLDHSKINQDYKDFLENDI